MIIDKVVRDLDLQSSPVLCHHSAGAPPLWKYPTVTNQKWLQMERKWHNFKEEYLFPFELLIPNCFEIVILREVTEDGSVAKSYCRPAYC
jgi:hypothetical protein